MARLLIVDDGKNIRRHLATYFEHRGHEVCMAESGEEALSLQAREPGFDLILTDYRMPEMNGLDLLQEVKARDANVEVILMTAYATVPNAVAAIKAGAYDYVMKPFSLEQIGHLVDRALEVRRLRSENRLLRDAIEHRPFLESQNAQMRRLLRNAQQFAGAVVPVLLIGESGTGKKALARQIHRWSARRDQSFVLVDCDGSPEDLLERELFGSVRKAASGETNQMPGRLEAADAGTVLLKNIDGLSLQLQKKLLQFVKHSMFERSGTNLAIRADTRIVADSTSDLATQLAEKRFREDLFHRLNVATLHVPPLRDRAEDILPLAEHLVSGVAIRNSRRRRLSLSPEAAGKLIRYHWPGNIRELRNVMERAAILAPKDVITPEHLPDAVLGEPSADGLDSALASTIRDREREHILRVLASTHSLEEAAEKLGINAATLWRKRRRYGLE